MEGRCWAPGQWQHSEHTHPPSTSPLLQGRKCPTQQVWGCRHEGRGHREEALRSCFGFRTVLLFSPLAPCRHFSLCEVTGRFVASSGRRPVISLCQLLWRVMAWARPEPQERKHRIWKVGDTTCVRSHMHEQARVDTHPHVGHSLFTSCCIWNVTVMVTAQEQIFPFHWRLL